MPALVGGLRVVALAGSALYQDAGRRHIDSGVPVSGAFDRIAHETATSLVGGTGADASVEIVGQLEVEVLVPVTCAVTGTASVSLDGCTAAVWTALDVDAGSRIQVYARGRGYLAVAGGFRPEAVLASRSTCLLGPLGPAPIRLGELLPVSATPTSRTVGDFARPPRRRGTVRVIPGPHEVLGSSTVRVLQTSRIGIRLTPGRLRGTARMPGARAGLPSLGVLPGTIQVLPTGDWMALGPDAGTMGGYPVAGVIRTEDLDAVAHLREGDPLDLEPDASGPASDPPRPTVVRIRGLRT